MMTALKNLWKKDHVKETPAYQSALDKMEYLSYFYAAKEDIFANMVSDAEELLHLAGLRAEAFALVNDENLGFFLAWPNVSENEVVRIKFRADSNKYHYEVCCSVRVDEVCKDYLHYGRILTRMDRAGNEKEEYLPERDVWENELFLLEDKIISFLQTDCMADNTYPVLEAAL